MYKVIPIIPTKNDYPIFAKWTVNGVYFVTRMKDTALYKVSHRWEETMSWNTQRRVPQFCQRSL